MNGAASIDRAGRLGTVTAAVTVTASTGGGGAELVLDGVDSTPRPPRALTTPCGGTPDHTVVGAFTETFAHHAPIAPARTTPTSCAFRTANCGNNASNTFILTGAVVVTAAPDLTVNKSHTGNFTVGAPATYTIAVSNAGSAATTGTVTVTDVQPAGLSFTGATGTGWTCSGTTTISCTRSNALAAGASYPDITLNVTPTAAGHGDQHRDRLRRRPGQHEQRQRQRSDHGACNGADLTINKTPRRATSRLG